MVVGTAYIGVSLYWLSPTHRLISRQSAKRKAASMGGTYKYRRYNVTLNPWVINSIDWPEQVTILVQVTSYYQRSAKLMQEYSIKVWRKALSRDMDDLRASIHQGFSGDASSSTGLVSVASSSRTGGYHGDTLSLTTLPR